MSDCERANRSGRSYQKNDGEQIAQGAHDKWATVSNSLRLLTKKNEWAIRSTILAKKSKILFFSMFYIGFLF